ncbi:MAG: DUF58 domain-containing protein [Verrucomicrobia subdivision 3 bacterium]|nr:DUF58 domain-containing protein [Limisphaerales bacterium]
MDNRAGPSLVNPKALMAIRNLEFRARIVVEGFWNGLHRSPYHGFSVEFTEFRQYSPGDDLRYLDWRVFARSDRYYIKKFEDETNLRCYLLVDHSKSMGYSSLPYTKSEYANTLAATIAYFLFKQGDAVGLLTFDERLQEFLPAKHRTGHLRQMMIALEAPLAGTATDLKLPLTQVMQMVRKRGVVVLISDLLAPLATVEGALRELAAFGHEALVFHVLDPAEWMFEFDQASIFEDVESGKKLYVDPRAVRKGYLGKIRAHCDAARELCQRRGIGYVRLTTDQPLELALFDFLRQRMERGKRRRALTRDGRAHSQPTAIAAS